ncbi:MAG: hypothetical protein V1766_07425 [Pseudomonadota bacterium]
MDSREVTFLIGFVLLGAAPVFAKHLAFGLTELIMTIGMIIAVSTAFSKST